MGVNYSRRFPCPSSFPGFHSWVEVGPLVVPDSSSLINERLVSELALRFKEPKWGKLNCKLLMMKRQFAFCQF